MRNHEVTQIQSLLNEAGEIAEPGWARQQVWQYHRSQIKAPAWKIKEWDYYLVTGDDFAVAFTLSDDGYVGLQSVSLLELNEHPWEHTETVLNAFPMGKMHLPETSSEGNIEYRDKRLHMKFEKREGERRIYCRFKNFYQGKEFRCSIRLKQPDMDTMVIATPWDKKHAFYYNQKINCMRADGYAEFDGKRYILHPDRNYGTLDWGRGVWTYDNTWKWGSGNATIDGHTFGFNIGYGFGNTSAATENILFYDGKAHKLDDIEFQIPYLSATAPQKKSQLPQESSSSATATQKKSQLPQKSSSSATAPQKKSQLPQKSSSSAKEQQNKSQLPQKSSSSAKEQQKKSLLPWKSSSSDTPRQEDYMSPWKFTSSDGRFEMDFVPILDRAACMDFKAIVSDQHQVFGRMSGKAVLDDGTVIHVKDMLMFAEKVHNRY